MDTGFIFISSPSISGIGYLVKSIVSVSTAIALGVVLFTLILKLITLPFDFLSRRSMRKNSLLMEKMRPELEKLQRQYANDKMKYNQKMQALYKKHGYSMAGACLPTIITLVVFIIAINGFTTFSSYQNKKYFYDMSVSYNQAYYDGFVYTDSDEPIKFGDNFEVVTNSDGEYVKLALKNEVLNLDEVKNNEQGSLPNSDFKFFKETENQTNYITVYNYDGYVAIKYLISGTTVAIDKIIVNADNLRKADIGFTGGTNTEAKTFLDDLAATYSYDRYKATPKSFLWVKNIWVTDSPMSHPINSNYKSFKQSFGDGIDELSYNNLISKMTAETKAPNGYFILVVLTAGVSLILQIVTSKSQKAQMELQTVDGQGARTNKMMTWIMPIMMAVFAFTMTAAFSIYMIVSSLFSILTTVLINKVVDFEFRKKALKEETESANAGKEVVRGRIYVKPQPVPEKKKSKKQLEAELRPDFMNDPKKLKKRKK